LPEINNGDLLPLDDIVFMSASAYLLDTNILSEIIKNLKGRIAKRIRQVGS
jgi:hypothetical protein